METKVIKVSADNICEAVNEAAEEIKKGNVVGIPTETVYGLGANALDTEAVKKIFLAKGRPQDNPLIVHISSFGELFPLVKEVPKEAEMLAEKFWPGPLTMIMPKSDKIPDSVCGGLDTVAVRMPSHPVMREIIRSSGVPIAAPSANISGSPSPTNAHYVYEDMKGKIPLIIDGGESEVGVESTVITLAENPPRLLRPGGITHSELESVLGKVDIDKAVLSQLENGQKASSPGMKYKHYAPETKVVIVKGSLDKYLEFISGKNEKIVSLCFEGEEEKIPFETVTYGKIDDSSSQAHRLFDALREVDRKGADIVYARCPSEEGVGLAVYNRLLRSAAFDVVEVY